MKTLIIDDERLARKELLSLLDSYPELEIVGEAVNADEAFSKIQSLKPELIFLDIQMPGKTGFELLEMLDASPKVIFTTAYDEFAIKAFDFNALDYLLKPINTERLAETINKLLSKDDKKDKEEKATPRKLSANDQVFVKDGDRCWFVKLADVRLFESDGNYIKVYFEKNKPMIHKSLNALDEKLDDRSFFRASRKHIINLGWVDTIEPWFNGGLMVQLKGGEKIEVSRRQAARFKDMMSL
ncbi:MAG: LytTR family transcriptional regulator DNA-binding domain-containing protein [Bacteroidota bacterium]